MTTGFDKLDPYSINENAFNLIGKDWMLIASGNINDYNMMTASWGSLGILWNKPIVSIFIRPQRYTFEFLEKNDFFTLNFLNSTHRGLLNVLGSVSGRDMDKMAVEGLSACETENKTVCFEQARLVLECKKLYYTDIDPAYFLDKAIAGNYPNKDFHRMYFGEVINTLVRK